MTFHWKTALAVASAALGLFACGGGGMSGTGASASGAMHLSLTDAPACGYDNVYLTVERIRVNKSDTAVDGDNTWSEVVLNPAKRIDLLTLTNGVLSELGQTTLPTGKYTQMRLVLAPNTGPGANPLANSIKPTGGTEVALSTPSAQQSGLKLNVNMDIAADQVADFAIDFDACKSIVKRGNSGQYNLKPVVTVIPVVSSAGMKVQGYVQGAVALPTTTVSLQLNGVPVKATVPDLNGRFVLYPVPVGNYALVVTAPGHVTGVVTDVPVTATAITTVNTLGTPITPPLATQRAITGTLDPSTATVRALQTLTGGPTVEVAWGLVEVPTVLPAPASFSLSLPIEAPVVAPYVALPASLNFAADSSASVSGKYTLEATSGTSIQPVPINANAIVSPVAFTFP
ncbi:hypothetical protein DIC66_15600 [Rhodoferax lacus]|uniref:DUF4382 domain-containing protein n=1 Tax=Rhodoferax lacus TaxID=2184758 RepID=A0A3E1R927_9BURK|nr:DUF4382 domain-containing protein [Rhodoferax lacus]RFO95868.1 hypothetical protein DIC66_15600 [Rhodoferax lacus]